MKEDFLHYVWKFRKFEQSGLHTCNNESITVHHPGQYLRLAGPVFFNAQITINQQKWAGNVEIHVRSSDWYLHQHEKDPAYENVILHVVWTHDTEVFSKNGHAVPVLELSPYVALETLKKYQKLTLPKSWIFCERHLASIDTFVIDNWLERLFIERLERKADFIGDLKKQLEQDWEAVLFCLLAKNFGLNTNGETFLKIAKAIPFAVLRKESRDPENMEALLFGVAGLLDNEKEDHYFHMLKARFAYLSHKYKIKKEPVGPVQFFKHRPDNLPTVRLSQLCSVYAQHQNLFSKIIAANSAKAIYGIFEVSPTVYWQTHYLFGREGSHKTKPLSKAFVGLLVINTIVPLQFAYAKSLGKEHGENAIAMLCEISAEDNSVIHKFEAFGIRPQNAFRTQSLLQLKSEYCAAGRCLECSIGRELLKND